MMLFLAAGWLLLPYGWNVAFLAICAGWHLARHAADERHRVHREA